MIEFLSLIIINFLNFFLSSQHRQSDHSQCISFHLKGIILLIELALADIFEEKGVHEEILTVSYIVYLSLEKTIKISQSVQKDVILGFFVEVKKFWFEIAVDHLN